MFPVGLAASLKARFGLWSGALAVIVVPGARGQGGVDGFMARQDLSELDGMDAVALWSDPYELREVRKVLAHRKGKLIPLLAEKNVEERCILERHVCVDTTAAGGNASLLAASSAHEPGI